MGGREVPYDPAAVCDLCGRAGAFDFMGDVICGQCIKAHAEETEPGEPEEGDE